MNQRTPLRKQLVDAWNECIDCDYQRQRINSERSLQASFWAKLNSSLSAKNRRLFIEPRMSVREPGSGKVHTRYPDIVVCNTRQIIGIVELKYQPRVKPHWQKDLETFDLIDQFRSQISVSNERFLGVKVDKRPYPLAKDVLFVWAGVHAEWPHEIGKHASARLQGSFLELHADTSNGSEATVRWA